MSVNQLFTNNAVALLQNNINPSDTVITVSPGLGALYPQPVNPGDFFFITLEQISPPLNQEIVSIIGRSGDVLTVGGRAQQNTIARSWTALQTLVDHRVTAADMIAALSRAASPGMITILTSFSYGDVSPQLLHIIPGGNFVYSAKIIIETPFDGTGASLSIGDSSNNQRIITTTQNDPTTLGQFSSDVGVYFTSTTNLNLYLTPGLGATHGAGVVVLQIQS